MTPSFPAELTEAARGLLYPSESEFPFEPVGWAKDDVAELTPQKIARLAGRPDDAVQVVEIDALFRNVARPHDWHDEAQAAAVPRFRRLERALAETLRGARAYRVGAVEIDVYLVGRTSAGDWAGLKTKVIET